MLSKNFNTYFSAKHILSKGALTSIVFSDRSDGKTFDCKARALLEYEENKNITIYMRRYKSEITSKMYSTFFDEVLNQEEYKRFRNFKFKNIYSHISANSPINHFWADLCNENIK